MHPEEYLTLKATKSNLYRLIRAWGILSPAKIMQKFLYAQEKEIPSF